MAGSADGTIEISQLCYSQSAIGCSGAALSESSTLHQGWCCCKAGKVKVLQDVQYLH